MRVIGRLIALFVGGLMVTAILGTIAARAAKRRIVPLDDPDADEVRLAAFFGPIAFRSTARHFRGGTIDCWDGGGVVDLREADLDPAGARLQVRAVFGGSQILVPETWQVTSKVIGIGGLGDARPRVDRDADAPQLSIEGIAVFGGFGVVSNLSMAESRGLEEAIARMAAEGPAAEGPALKADAPVPVN